MASDVFPVVGALIAQFCIKRQIHFVDEQAGFAVDDGYPLGSGSGYSPVVRHLAVAAFDDCSIGKGGAFADGHQHFGLAVAVHIVGSHHVVVSRADLDIGSHVDAPQKDAFAAVSFHFGIGITGSSLAAVFHHGSSVILTVYHIIVRTVAV